MKKSPCPICKGPRKTAEHNPTYPFCGPRCKLADLSNWMNGSYALDPEPANPEEVEAAVVPEKPPTLH
jgi:endogenous inhibitor of DNA gyrase (YacG/DUF329 family)